MRSRARIDRTGQAGARIHLDGLWEPEMPNRVRVISHLELELYACIMRMHLKPIESLEHAEQMQALTMIKNPELRRALDLPTLH